MPQSTFHHRHTDIKDIACNKLILINLSQRLQQTYFLTCENAFVDFSLAFAWTGYVYMIHLMRTTNNMHYKFPHNSVLPHLLVDYAHNVFHKNKAIAESLVQMLL